jgi:hypothetical protein
MQFQPRRLAFLIKLLFLTTCPQFVIRCAVRLPLWCRWLPRLSECAVCFGAILYIPVLAIFLRAVTSDEAFLKVLLIWMVSWHHAFVPIYVNGHYTHVPYFANIPSPLFALLLLVLTCAQVSRPISVQVELLSVAAILAMTLLLL